MRVVAAAIDPDLLTVAQAAEGIREATEIEKAAAGMRLRLSRRIDNEGFWGGGGDRSAEDWLAKLTGQSKADAARDLECSRRLKALPGADDAVRNGELSPDQAKEVADGAAADPAAEKELLDTARRGSFGELRRKAKARKSAALGDDTARHAAAHRNRGYKRGVNDKGEAWGSHNGPAHHDARLNALLKPFRNRLFAKARREGRRERFEATEYDALMAALGIEDIDEVADTGRDDLDAGATATGTPPPAPSSGPAATTDPEPTPPSSGPDRPTTGPTPTAQGAPAPTDCPAPPAPDSPTPADGSASSAPEASTAADRPARPPLQDAPAHRAPAPGRDLPLTPARLVSRPNVALIMRIDAAALRRGHTVAGELCDIDGVAVTVADILEFLPQAAISVVIQDGVDAFNVTNFSRRANVTQQIVLHLLDIGCSRLGCPATEHLQVDHRVDWHKVHVTELSNLDWLCPDDHKRKTHQGWQLEPGTGKRRMLPLGGQFWLDDTTEPARPPGDPPHTQVA